MAAFISIFVIVCVMAGACAITFMMGCEWAEDKHNVFVVARDYQATGRRAGYLHGTKVFVQDRDFDPELDETL